MLKDKLIDIEYNEELILQHYSFFKSHYNLKNTISVLLHLIKFSQHPQARKQFYRCLCFMFLMGKMSQRPFRIWSAKSWTYWNFFISHNQDLFYRYMEYYLSDICYFELDASMWYSKKRENFSTLIIPFDKYLLRVPNYLFYTLWFYMEAIRRTKYNEVIKGHFYSCGKSRIKKAMLRRYRWKWRFEYTWIWRFRWYKNLDKKPFILFMAQFRDNLTNYKPDILTAPFILNHKNIIALQPILYKNPLIINNNILYEFMLWRYVLLANFLVSHCADYFSGIGRLDVPIVQIVLWCFTWKTYYINFLYRMSSIFILEEWFDEIVDKDDHNNYEMIKELILARKKIPFRVTFLLKKFYFNIRVSTYYNGWWIKKLLNKYRFNFEHSSTEPSKYAWWHKGNRITLWPLYSYLFFGVDNYLTTDLIPITYWIWRDFSRNGEEYRLDEAKLPLEFFFETLNMEYYISGEYSSLWVLFMLILRQKKYLLWTNDLSSLKQYKKDKQSFFTVKSKDYMIEKSEAQRPLNFPILKLSDYIYYKTIDDMYYFLFKRSIKLAFLCHFLIFKELQLETFEHFSWHQHRLWANIPNVYYTWSRFYDLYKFVFASKYRRYVTKRWIMSRNDPSLREIGWEVYFHKMRRTGIKVPDDLPYYSLTDADDHIKDLTNIRIVEGYDQFHNSLWTMDVSK